MATEQLAENISFNTQEYVPASIAVGRHESKAHVESTPVRRDLIPGYQIIERIGAGGYGEVWRAEAPGGLAKAVKIVFGLAGEKRATEEWKSLARVKDVRHPFLLSLERIEVVDDQLVVVTELADGSLKNRYEQCVAVGQPGIPREELLGYLAEAADVLDYMTTEHGLQHLDVKPENLLLVGGHIKVADFGLVRSIHNATVSIVGGLTPLFTSPETFDGRPSDRSDQYSLAIVYQALLTGRYPFDGQSLARLTVQHLNSKPDVMPLPVGDRSAIERALAKDPFDRFPSCRALVERLRGNGFTSSPVHAAVPIPAVKAESRPLKMDVASSEFKTEIVDVQALKAEGVSANANLDTESIGRAKQGTIADLPPFQLAGTDPLRPTLFVGLGGCGARTLCALAGRLEAKFGSLDAIPSLRVLLIDTDRDTFRTHFAAGRRTTLDDGKFLHVSLKPTSYYRGKADDLTRWLSRRWIYNIPKSLKTDGARPLGRLALVDHITDVECRMNAELASACDPHAVASSRTLLARDFDADRPRVVLVGSIAGGTGGGMVWDVAQLARELLRQRGIAHPEIVCVLAHWSFPTAREVELATVNTCASLYELQHYVTEGCPGDTACHLPPLGRQHGLLDNVYLVNFGALGSDESFDAASDALAQYLEADATTCASGFITRCRQASEVPDRNTATIRTFSAARIDSDDLLAADLAGQHLIGRACQRWLTHGDRPSERELVSAEQSCDKGTWSFPHDGSGGSLAPFREASETPIVRIPVADTHGQPVSDDDLPENARQLLAYAERTGLEQEIDEILSHELQETAGEPFAGQVRRVADIFPLAKYTLAIAHRRLVEHVTLRAIEANQPGLLVCGGTRRYFLAASEVIREAGLVNLIQAALPAEATIAVHDTDELLILCEAQGIPVGVIIANLAQKRPDLLDLVRRVPARCDVPWATS